ncbi:sensor histidine kinase [Faucicola atlantae]|uniref:sensor histidine kinase n=1 Tax=Faucicola atlantae TaxID=34059 RepID=UPI0025B12D26|nr:sensor histidine kinase [Moraxella atlantae]
MGSATKAANWRQYLSKPRASIAKPDHTLPLSDIRADNRLFFPTLNSHGGRFFWLGVVIFFSFYETATLLHFIDDWQQLGVQLFRAISTTGLIVLFSVGYLSSIAPQLAQKTRPQMFWCVMVTVMVAVPLADLVAAGLQWLILGTDTDVVVWLSRTFIDLLIAPAVAMLFFYHFNYQYTKNCRHQQQLEQRLIEQNEQLKARISPHFFFNMLNTMQYLIETDRTAAEALIRSISSLYRMSFDEVREVALIDEIEICQHYLNIEQYRFGEKLIVHWLMPDEDTLYDMVIPSLMLQMLLEKMINFVVEMVDDTVTIWVAIKWQDDQVSIELSCVINPTNYASIQRHAQQYLNFSEQTRTLQRYFGKQASIDYQLDSTQMLIGLHYPLKDVGTLM